MGRETLQQWAKRFVADLQVDGESVSFDGTVNIHIQAIRRFRDERLRSKNIWRAIVQAGGFPKVGGHFSEGQFRMAVSRAIKATQKRPSATERIAKSRRRKRTAETDSTASERRRNVGSASSGVSSAPASRASSANAPMVDVSDDEIHAALTRLKRAK